MLKNVLYSGGGFSSLDNQRDQMGPPFEKSWPQFCIQYSPNVFVTLGATLKNSTFK